MELFNAALPGRVFETDESTARGWFGAGWRAWDELTADEQAAHDDAVAAAEAAERAAHNDDAAAEAAADDTDSTSTPTGGESTEQE